MKKLSRFIIPVAVIALLFFFLSHRTEEQTVAVLQYGGYNNEEYFEDDEGNETEAVAEEPEVIQNRVVPGQAVRGTVSQESETRLRLYTSPGADLQDLQVSFGLPEGFNVFFYNENNIWVRELESSSVHFDMESSFADIQSLTHRGFIVISGSSTVSVDDTYIIYVGLADMWSRHELTFDIRDPRQNAGYTIDIHIEAGTPWDEEKILVTAPGFPGFDARRHFTLTNDNIALIIPHPNPYDESGRFGGEDGDTWPVIEIYPYESGWHLLSLSTDHYGSLVLEIEPPSDIRLGIDERGDVVLQSPPIIISLDEEGNVMVTLPPNLENQVIVSLSDEEGNVAVIVPHRFRLPDVIVPEGWSYEMLPGEQATTIAAIPGLPTAMHIAIDDDGLRPDLEGDITVNVDRAGNLVVTPPYPLAEDDEGNIVLRPENEAPGENDENEGRLTSPPSSPGIVGLGSMGLISEETFDETESSGIGIGDNNEGYDEYVGYNEYEYNEENIGNGEENNDTDEETEQEAEPVVALPPAPPLFEIDLSGGGVDKNGVQWEMAPDGSLHIINPGFGLLSVNINGTVRLYTIESYIIRTALEMGVESGISDAAGNLIAKHLGVYHFGLNGHLIFVPNNEIPLGLITSAFEVANGNTAGDGFALPFSLPIMIAAVSGAVVVPTLLGFLIFSAIRSRQAEPPTRKALPSR